MNLEEAKEYAKTMTYKEAVSNVRRGKFVLYRKATMIKLRELAEIADRLDNAATIEPKLLDDGTLVVTVEDATMIDKINRVIVEDGHMWCGLYYADEETKGYKFDEWCTDCKEYDTEHNRCPRWNQVIRKTVKDMEEEYKPKKGEWIVTQENGTHNYIYRCSVCEWYEYHAYPDVKGHNFCPNCGSRNREVITTCVSAPAALIVDEQTDCPWK